MATKHKLVFVMLFIALLGGLSGGVVFASGMEQAQLAIPVLVVNTSFLNVRSGDGPQYTVVATVVGGTELPALAVNPSGTWYLVSTPVGNGWVDVSFTLPRGDFRFVPVVRAEVSVQPAGSPPLSIGLVNPPARNLSAAVAAAPTTSERARVNVTSVNLRAQPGDGAAVLTVLYASNNGDYPVVGRAFDARFVEWTAITVQNFGTGWVESNKLEYRTVQGAAAVPSAPAASSTGIPVPQLATSVIVINTAFLNVRSGAGGQFTAIATVPGGTTFTPLGITPDLAWYLVRGEFGFGWVSSDFVLFRGDFRTVPILRNLY